jgi:hypothetical protein
MQEIEHLRSVVEHLNAFLYKSEASADIHHGRWWRKWLLVCGLEEANQSDMAAREMK